MEDVDACWDLRVPPMQTVRREPLPEGDGAKEAFTLAWRPAGSGSLAERWLKAGEAPKKPAPPSLPRALKTAVKRTARRLKK